jgi:hypothetical protein
MASGLTGCGKRQETAPSPTPTPVPVLPRKNYDLARLYTGLRLRSSVECTPGGDTATATFADTNAYAVDVTLRVRWPAPATNTAQMSEATPGITLSFTNLPALLEGGHTSQDYATLLANKERSLRSHLAALQKLPYRDSLFDCQTILDLRNPSTGRKALLVQAIMNVNTDGSDGDRNLGIDHLSATFQPQTSYRWPKTGPHPNPCLGEAVTHRGQIDAALGSGTLTPDSMSSLREERDRESATIEDLKHWDFLVGAGDPFIVLPSFMLGKRPGQPVIGDFAVVLAGGKAYPAVVGDMGPNHKIGEASLRICKEINADAGADRRPVSTPGVVYLVFPGTAVKPFATPDYARWSARCRELWKEFGGDPAIPWKEWTSLEQPWPTPTPSPSPSAETTAAPAPGVASTSTSISTPIFTPTPIPTTGPSPSIGTNPADSGHPSPSASPSTSVLPSSSTNG